MVEGVGVGWRGGRGGYAGGGVGRRSKGPLHVKVAKDLYMMLTPRHCSVLRLEGSGDKSARALCERTHKALGAACICVRARRAHVEQGVAPALRWANEGVGR